MSSADTIFALATPPGKSGVAILRLSGTRSLTALQRLTGQLAFMPRYAHYVTFQACGNVIDTGLALYFKGPHSFTGEDVAECHVHGSLAVIREMLAALGDINGLRSADPGEFTRRAFANGKIDLIEAEGMADLIEAETSQQKAQALSQMQGILSGYYEELRGSVTRCLALLEAYIDFPDEDIPDSVLSALENDIKALQVDIAAVLDDQRRGERLRAGITVVILGAPNVGKSSLLNAIARRDVAIVSYKAGTTRDTIETHLDIAGYPVVLVDTAGLRESGDEIEAEGIRRALARAGDSDLKLVLFDGAQWPKKDAASAALVDGQSLEVVSKCDLLDDSRREANRIYISTRTGEGIDQLLQVIEQRIIMLFASQPSPFITQSRHRALLCEAAQFINKSLKNESLELRCEELRQAAQAIGKITGKIQVDDVLDVIFKRFCIGK